MRADCHIHLDKIGGPHKTLPPSIELFLEYARREQISLFFAIYEQEATMARFVETGLDFVPVYWERKPLTPSVPITAKAIKLHPYIENYPLILENVAPALEEAQARNLFVCIHTEDRTPALSRGALIAKLAATYPDLVFIMYHSGSYAPPNLQRESLVDDNLIRELVSEAVDVARQYENIYLETSILASDIKTEILSNAPISKLLIGTDFPILEGTQWQSLDFQEKQLVVHGLSRSDIENIHKNAFAFV